MKITTQYPKNEYLSSLKERMDSFFHIGAERCSGIFLGPVVCITYHSGWEWNRQITGQKNTAVGFVSKNGSGSKLNCIILKGMLAPHLFLLLFSGIAIIYFLATLIKGIDWEEVRQLFLPFCLIASVGFAVISAFHESLTEESDSGRKILISILLDPKDPFSYLNHKNEIK